MRHRSRIGSTNALLALLIGLLGCDNEVAGGGAVVTQIAIGPGITCALRSSSAARDGGVDGAVAMDAGTDSAVADAGEDAGGEDAGTLDAGAMDAGVDAGVDSGFDAGAPDAGVDAGSLAGSIPLGAGGLVLDVPPDRLSCWFVNGTPQISDVSPVEGRLALGDPTCVVSSAGRLQCLGPNGNGQLGNGTVDLGTETLTPVSIGQVASVETSRFGPSGGGDGSPFDPGGGANTMGFACAIDTTGEVLCWGAGERGQIGNGTAMDVSVPQRTGVSAAQLAIGGAHVCAITPEGTVSCWGAGERGQLGDGTSVDRSIPTPVVEVEGFESPVQLALGQWHSCVLTAAGEVWCWGGNDAGQLGDTSVIDQAVPVQTNLSMLSSPLALLVAGGAHTCALTVAGEVACWGANANGQLGISGEVVQPTLLESLPGAASALAAGLNHTCAIVGGEVFCWGFGASLGLGAGTLDTLTPTQVSVN
ncbi:MAG: hypothetical protein AAGE52_08400 [Myxococcota bacterium]